MMEMVPCVDCGELFAKRSCRQSRCAVCQHEYTKANMREYWRRLHRCDPEKVKRYNQRRRDYPSSARFDHSGKCVDCGQPIYRNTSRTIRCSKCQAEYSVLRAAEYRRRRKDRISQGVSAYEPGV